MLPVLFRLGRLEIHGYGLLLAVSFLVGIYWAMYRAQKRGLDRNKIMDMSLIIIISAVVGSRFFYVITHIDEFRGHWLDSISPFQSSGTIGIAGLSMLGGVVLAIAAILIYCRIKKLPLLKILDVMAPCFAMGLFLTRIGCFLNGCCFGKPSDLPWGIRFPLNSAAGSIFQETIHPTQLYSSLYGLVILLVILILERKPRFTGFSAAVFFVMYGTGRFLVDWVRYYETSVTFSVLGTLFTFNQVISLCMALAGVIFLLKHRKAGRPE